MAIASGKIVMKFQTSSVPGELTLRLYSFTMPSMDDAEFIAYGTEEEWKILQLPVYQLREDAAPLRRPWLFPHMTKFGPPLTEVTRPANWSKDRVEVEFGRLPVKITKFAF